MTKLAKILFAPFAVIGGLVAGWLGRKTFAWVWARIDDEPAPEPALREASWPKVVAGLALEGAIFRATRGVVDRSMRGLFAGLTGIWPGESRAQRGSPAP